MEKPYYPGPKNQVTSRIPNYIPEDFTKPVYTPRETDVCPQPNNDLDWYDEPDYTQAVAQGMQEVLAETPRLSRSEAEEQMHLTELRRLAEAYSANDAQVLCEVLAKNYPLVMFDALGNEFSQMKYTLDTITGAVNSDTQ